MIKNDPAQLRWKKNPAPVDIILEKRSAAGCDTLPEAHDAFMGAEYEEYLCVNISDETYGIDIMQIKEIIKSRRVTEIPHSPSFVAGVISLRGAMVPVLYTLAQPNLERSPATPGERVVVVKTGAGLTGLIVDSVSGVVRIARSAIEAAPAVTLGISREFISGIGQVDNRMLVLLNVERVAHIPPWQSEPL